MTTNQYSYKELSKNIFDCKVCPTPCDGVSKMNYNFMNDVEFAEKNEAFIRDQINLNSTLLAKKCEEEGYPDIAIYDKASMNLKKYVEVKAQRRTFMSVERILPKSNLKPSETLALNLSDLLRYFDIKKKVNLPIFIVWIVTRRPCVTGKKSYKYFYQSVDELERIYSKYKEKRKFRRKSGQGDIVDGIHKGVVVNYHFSINELIEKNL